YIGSTGRFICDSLAVAGTSANPVNFFISGNADFSSSGVGGTHYSYTNFHQTGGSFGVTQSINFDDGCNYLLEGGSVGGEDVSIRGSAHFEINGGIAGAPGWFMIVNGGTVNMSAGFILPDGRF